MNHGTSFHCPKCIGSSYGTFTDSDGIERRSCHSEGHYRCPGFQWLPSEDWKYMRFYAIPESAEEFDRLRSASVVVVVPLEQEPQRRYEQAEQQVVEWAERADKARLEAA
jgi:hypothetical protein